MNLDDAVTAYYLARAEQRKRPIDLEAAVVEFLGGPRNPPEDEDPDPKDAA